MRLQFFVAFLPAICLFARSASGKELEPAWPGLPAWELETEKLSSGKADEWDDYRGTHPEWFGVTAPPVVPVRPFAEYEPSQAMIIRPSGDISKFHREIIQRATGHVERIVLIHTPGQKAKMKGQLKGWGLLTEAVEFVEVEKTNANWTRDYGPLSAVTADGRIGFIDMRYYHGRAYDDAIPTWLGAAWGVNVFRPSMSFEGGNFMADPHGTCYATEKIYNQNPGHSKAEIDQWMKEYLGCTAMVIYKLPKGLGTGHVDMFSKLMDDDSVLLGYYDPALRPANAAILDENEKILKGVVTQAGLSLEVIRIPLPWDESGVWYTYTNSLIVNDAVLVPVYSKFKDLEEEAMEAYEKAAPGLEILKINSDAIIPAGGAIHCVTMSVPNGKLAKFQEDPVQLCPFNEVNKCDEEGIACGGLAYEGACDGGTLKYCGFDGYPHAQECDECCGWDPLGLEGMGWYNCLTGDQCVGCIDECEEGETGCSAYHTHSWTCGQADEDECLERIFTPCKLGTTCAAGTSECAKPQEVCPGGVCPDNCGEVSEEGVCQGNLLIWCDHGELRTQDCAAEGKICGPVPSLGGELGCWEGCEDLCPVEGARGCSSDGTAVLICAQDLWGCLSFRLEEECPAGTVCFDGVCKPIIEELEEDLVSPVEEPPPYELEARAEEPSCDCSVGRCAPRGWGASAGLLLLLAGLRLSIYARRRRT